jgi:VIT1/CCC1 family predicted Fe2+/Mn2+ transporter
MDSDVQMKLIFTGGMATIYSIIFLTQKIDVATVASLVSGFSNALIGVFAYNWAKSKKEVEQEVEQEVKKEVEQELKGQSSEKSAKETSPSSNEAVKNA